MIHSIFIILGILHGLKKKLLNGNNLQRNFKKIVMPVLL
jgi:hypothetical protein